MEMEISFPGGKKVDAHYQGRVIRTDQPVSDGGEDAGPTPFGLFAVSLGTCIGYYVLSFCQQRKLKTEDMRISIVADRPAGGLIKSVAVAIHVPKDFPDRYTDAVIKAAGSCLVKKHLEQPPAFTYEVVKDS